MLICVLTACVLLCGAFCTAAAAASDAAAETTTAAADASQGGSTTLSGATVASLSKLITEAKGDSKAEDKRTPRDKLTAAYLASDLEGAKAAIKGVNDAQKTPLAIDYDSITLDDVAALIEAMKTEVSLDKPTGFFTAIQLAAGTMLSWLTYTLGGGNYIAGIVIFGFILEIVMLPLTIKQQKNTIKQASLKPKEMAIRKKYAGREDQATKNKIVTEIQEMYQKENFSPFSGCLPLLIQIPVIWILYNVVVNPIIYVMKLSSGISDALITFANTSAAAGGLGETAAGTMRGTIRIASLISEHPDFFEKLKDFQYFKNSGDVAAAVQGATLPNFSFFGLNFGLVPTLSFKPFDWLIFIPLLTFAVYFASMKLTRKMTYQPVVTDQAAGCSNNIMDIGMPVMSAYFCFLVPAALGFYWMVKSIFGTLSRFIVSKLMPLPVFTEEDYKAAEKEYRKGRSGSSKSASAEPRPGVTGKPVRSLHHIDDEDFEDTREKALLRKQKLEEEQRKIDEEAEKKKATSGVKNEEDRPMLTLKEMFGKLKKKNASVESGGKTVENANADKKSNSDKKENEKK